MPKKTYQEFFFIVKGPCKINKCQRILQFLYIIYVSIVVEWLLLDKDGLVLKPHYANSYIHNNSMGEII